jgi:uncharacterized protein (TIGR02453 family)
MINKELVSFFEKLNHNNNREWFQQNKPEYDKLKKEFEVFVAQVIAVWSKTDKSIAYLEPKDCVFRIYRDTRFSKDKTPYKNNTGAYMVKGGKNSPNAGYYIHVEPGGSFIAGGIYMPMPDVLKKVRTSIYENIDEFLEIINNPTFVKHFGKIDDEMKLKTPPKGFPKDFEHIEYLKFKNYTVSKAVSQQVLCSSKLMDEVITVFSAMQPLISFMNEIIDNE